MTITRLLAAIGLFLALAGVVAPAGAVPADKGPASRDCEGADVRATRIDQNLCATKAAAQTNLVGTIEQTSSVAHRNDSQWWAPVVLVGVVIAGGTAFLLRRPSTTT